MTSLGNLSPPLYQNVIRSYECAAIKFCKNIVCPIKGLNHDQKKIVSTEHLWLQYYCGFKNYSFYSVKIQLDIENHGITVRLFHRC